MGGFGLPFCFINTSMNTRILSCPVPANINPLSPNGYLFAIEKLPSISFFCQEVNLPELSLQDVTQYNPFSKIALPGDVLDYGDLTVQFIVDDSMTNYKAIYSWLTGLGFPESHEQYTKLLEEASIQANSEVARATSDGTLVILNNTNSAVQTVQFTDLIPTSLQSLNFISNLQDVQYLIGSATFKYTSYKFL